MPLNIGRSLASAAFITLAIAIFAACSDDNPTFPSGVQLANGTWGGDNAGMIVNADGAHVHIGCTFGNIPGDVAIDENGEFSVAGSYVLRAYPIQLGPSLPAIFLGEFRGAALRLTVIVHDTVENRVEIKGPVIVIYGDEPRLGPCPICKTPAIRRPGE